MLRQFRSSLVLAAVSLAFTACAHAPTSDRVEAVSAEAPPKPRAERAGHSPHPGWAWVSGYWNLVNGRFVWVPGYWTVPPRDASRWQGAYWYHDRRQGWILVKGYWR